MGDRIHVSVDDVATGHFVDLQVHQQPFACVQLVEAARRHTQGTLDARRAQVLVQVDHPVETLRFQSFYQVPEVAAQFMHAVQVGVISNQVGEGLFRGEVDLGTGYLFLQTAQHGTGEHDVTDGG